MDEKKEKNQMDDGSGVCSSETTKLRKLKQGFV